jgi:hypothetical protein
MEALMENYRKTWQEEKQKIKRNFFEKSFMFLSLYARLPSLILATTNSIKKEVTNKKL